MTSSSAGSQSSQDAQVELAQIRTTLALDRTLLAWIRTSLTLIGFGFTLARLVYDFIARGELRGINPEYPRQLGIIMILLGISGLVMGTMEYRRMYKRLPTGVVWPWSGSVILALTIATLSILLLVSLDIKLSPAL